MRLSLTPVLRILPMLALFGGLHLQAASGAVACRELFQGINSGQMPSIMDVHQFRLSTLNPNNFVNKGTLIPQTLSVNSRPYTTIGRLGISTSEAFLGQTPEGQLAVVKMAHDPNEELASDRIGYSQALIYYEIAVTKFYLELGITVPKILDLEIQEGRMTIVKEYVEGITGDDLAYGNYKTSRQVQEFMLDGMMKELLHLKKVFAADDPSGSTFEKWLRANRDVLEREYPALRGLRDAIERSENTKFIDYFAKLLRSGDFRKSNMIWNPQSQLWISFDP